MTDLPEAGVTSISRKRDVQRRNARLCVTNLPPDITNRELLLSFNVELQRNAGSAIASEARIATDPETGDCVGYGFLEFHSEAQASKAFERVKNGLRLIGKGIFAQIQWAKCSTSTPVDEFQLYIANLSPDVNDAQLLYFAKQFNANAIRAKVITDSETGISRGYGFVLFDSCSDFKLTMKAFRQNRADYKLLAGHDTQSAPIVVREVYRLPGGGGGPNNGSGQKHSKLSSTTSPNSFMSAGNTTVFVANLSESVNEDDLRTLFAYFGRIISVNQSYLKRIAFVNFTEHVAALAAITHLNQAMFKSQRLALAWSFRPYRSLYLSDAVDSMLHEEYLTSERSFARAWRHRMTPCDDTLTSDSGTKDFQAKHTGGSASRSGERKPENDQLSTNEMEFWLSTIAGGTEDKRRLDCGNEEHDEAKQDVGNEEHDEAKQDVGNEEHDAEKQDVSTECFKLEETRNAHPQDSFPNTSKRNGDVADYAAFCYR